MMSMILSLFLTTASAHAYMPSGIPQSFAVKPNYQQKFWLAPGKRMMIQVQSRSFFDRDDCSKAMLDMPIGQMNLGGGTPEIGVPGEYTIKNFGGTTCKGIIWMR